MTDPSGQDAERLLARIAERVQTARKARGFPRRVLSERSGVSPRYLAQLEAGEGNISVVLLQRIASALGLRLDMLVNDARPQDRDSDRIGQLYQDAHASVQAQVRQLLAPQNPEVLRAGRICLIGLRGAGKSTLGRMAADALNLPFVELTAEIENSTGMPMADLLALYGQDGYRRLEADAVSHVIERHERVVMAAAGGIVTDNVAYDALLERFHCIWIRTAPAEHMQRVRAQGDLRPMEGNPAAMDVLKSLLEDRSPLYARAVAQVDTSNKTIPTSLNVLLTQIAKHGFLDQVSA